MKTCTILHNGRAATLWLSDERGAWEMFLQDRTGVIRSVRPSDVLCSDADATCIFAARVLLNHWASRRGRTDFEKAAAAGVLNPGSEALIGRAVQFPGESDIFGRILDQPGYVQRLVDKQAQLRVAG